MKKIRVMLVDDHALIREGLRTMINAEADTEVVSEADCGLKALEVFRRTKPDIVILDISLPDYSGLQVAAQLIDIAQRSDVASRIIILSMYAKESLVDRALQTGVYGYLSKCSPSSEIIKAIRSVYAGNHYICPTLAALLVPKYIKQQHTQTGNDAYNLLTPREQEIFRLLVEGQSNQRIAVLLSISDKTVQRHRANLMTKLNVKSYRELLHYGIKIGLFEPIDDALGKEEQTFL